VYVHDFSRGQNGISQGPRRFETFRNKLHLYSELFLTACEPRSPTRKTSYLKKWSSYKLFTLNVSEDKLLGICHLICVLKMSRYALNRIWSDFLSIFSYPLLCKVNMCIMDHLRRCTHITKFSLHFKRKWKLMNRRLINDWTTLRALVCHPCYDPRREIPQTT